MRYRDKQSCQSWYERELKEAGQRLESLRACIHRLRLDLRPEWERRLDDVRGRHNRGVARLEALRRANSDGWTTAAERAEEALAALREALSGVDEALSLRQMAA
ncbi:MAG: hypothetical protein WCO00_05740 [Rhodospirillaceae bacterium]